ncbi:uxu operon transcriptional regulator [Asticcacaulis biprosthecium C19]|uniref:Uxu operon transcriptional regulator n=1 Tax=Asticcacaulis biprosthecium C19 TaxID=715226 RepID=F4QUA2_9CAUL|nr:FCD domain-containing protein [Asticcacaulis biprosthecium]EGF89402.1 uxu operon transcriptional regulator [Asticcacaulis biprosthecium C19]
MDGNNLRADKERRAYHDVGNDLIRRIRTGEFGSSGRLPTERDLAQWYEVGRTVIRDALVMLEVKGLVEPRQGSGIYITKRAYEAAPDAVRMETPSLPPAGPFELLQARQWLESHIARLAAVNATAEDMEIIEKAAHNHSRAHYGEPKENYDIQFHMAIAQATQNSELALLVSQLWHRRDDNPLWRSLNEHIKDAHYRDRWVNDHELIVEALRRRDGDAAFVAMWTHIENVKSFLLASNALDDTRPASKRKTRP